MEYVKVNANGRSGGLISMWSTGAFKKDMEVTNQNFILVKGKVTGEEDDMVVVNVYAPTIQSNRRQLWDELLELKQSIHGRWILLGDFNEVRYPEDRFNSQFDAGGALCFNNFIMNAGLQEYNMGGKRFTYMSGDGRNLSKIDRVLVCGEFVMRWPDATLLALNRDVPDHCPLVLTTIGNNFGPTPFRIFHSWMEASGFDEAIKKGLNVVVESNFKDECMASKLKAIKEELKKWRISEKAKEEEQLAIANENIQKLESVAETRPLTDQEIGTWQGYKKMVKDWQIAKTKDLMQQSRIKWIALGDENSTFFHAVVNSHKIRNKVNGLWIDGVWVTEANVIKERFMVAFKEKFKEPVHTRPRIGMEGFKRLSDNESSELIVQFKEEEVRKAIWECGGDKAPGPDGVTFSVIKNIGKS
ncbi:uncharacterized protein LOC110892565 [Helianthus annuus]|uniref:uncharacterized protein LOC110892565 n=1 Tax=Helianthus annuus TaxID=4232 RepID=UPI000B8FBDFD|nr:uncharacterized protein LOC110892565 [Helianthus annuus]